MLKLNPQIDVNICLFANLTILKTSKYTNVLAVYRISLTSGRYIAETFVYFDVFNIIRLANKRILILLTTILSCSI